MADQKPTNCIKANEPPTAGILIIGDEILKGHTKDTNSYFLLTSLWSLGVKVKAVSVISDDVDEIVSHVRDFSSRFTHVLTSGGIGPTHDDLTIMAVAKAFDEPLVLNQPLADVIAKVYGVKQLSSFHLKMAQVPLSAKLSYNHDADKTTHNLFPLMSVHNVHIFPGVPSLLQNLFNSFSHMFSCPTMNFYLHKIYLSVEESTVAAQLQEVHDAYGDDVHLGSYPELGCVEFQTKLTLESLFPDTLSRALEHLISLLPADVILRREALTSAEAKSAISGSSFTADSVKKPPRSVCEKIRSFLSSKDLSHISCCVKGAWAVLQETLVQYTLDELCISFNGGKDCTALLAIYCAVVKEKYPSYSGKLNALFVQVDSPFPEADKFLSECAEMYNLEIFTIKAGIKQALESLKVSHPQIKAMLMGTRKHDPYSDRLKLFSPTDPNWPEYMRINPILNWEYADVWQVLRECEIPYLSLYDRGYTSIGGKHSTKPNPALKMDNGDYKPAYMLEDGTKERDGRI